MEQTKGRLIGVAALIVCLSLPAGYLVLSCVEFLISYLWFTVPDTLGTPVLWLFTLGLPTLAGAVVVWLRKVGNDGHSPLAGISFAPVAGKDYPTVIGAIVVTLASGLVLGPEAAMVCTGAVIGTVVGTRFNLPIKTSVSVGSGAAILALLINPIIHGTFNVASAYVFRTQDILGALFVAAATSVVIFVGRKAAIKLATLPSAKAPSYRLTVGAGLTVGLLAMVYYSIWGTDVSLVMTSGEGSVKDLLALGSLGMILATVAFKWAAYSISLGAGFRGGPYFPSIFIGAGIGGAISLVAPEIAVGGAVAGMVAAVVYLAHPGWVGVVVIGAVLSLIGGGVALVPLGVVAAVVAKLIPAVTLDQEPAAGGTVT